MGYGMDRDTVVRVQKGEINIEIRSVEADPWFHPAPYCVGIWVSSRGKEAEA